MDIMNESNISNSRKRPFCKGKAVPFEEHSTKLKIEAPYLNDSEGVDETCFWVKNYTEYLSPYEGYVANLSLLQDLIQDFEVATHSYFIVQRTKRSFGKEADLKKISGSIHWQDTQDGTRPRLRADGIPFIIMGTRTMDCHHGPDRDKKRKHHRVIRNKQKEFCKYLQNEHDYTQQEWLHVRASKKLNCPAKVYIRHIVKFPEYECPDAITEMGHRHAVAARLQLDLKRRENIVSDNQFHIQLPSSHANHIIGEEANSILPIDRHLSAFIHKKVIEDNITNAKDMKKILEELLKESEFLFKGKPLPSRKNTRYWPTLKQIRNHIMLAKMQQREIKASSFQEDQSNHYGEDDKEYLNSMVIRVQNLTKEVDSLAGMCEDPNIISDTVGSLEHLRDILLQSNVNKRSFPEETIIIKSSTECLTREIEKSS